MVLSVATVLPHQQEAADWFWVWHLENEIQRERRVFRKGSQGEKQGKKRHSGRTLPECIALSTRSSTT